MHITILVGEELDPATKRLRAHLDALVLHGAIDDLRWRREQQSLVACSAASPFVDEHRVGDGGAARMSILCGVASDEPGRALGPRDMLECLRGDLAVPDGEFAFFDLEQPADTEVSLRAMVDRFGSRPIYYGRTNNLVVVSTDALTAGVAIGAGALDRGAVDDLLTFGHAVTPTTTISGISRLEPGTCLEATVNGSRVETGIRRAPPLEWMGDADSLEDAFDALVAGADRRLGWLAGRSDQIVCQLSAGLDSRITCAAVRATRRSDPTAFTLGLDDDAEIRIARQVAEALGLNHRSEAIGIATPADATVGFLLTGGQVPLHAAAGNVCAYRAFAADALAVFGAWPGDVLAGSYVPTDPLFVTPAGTQRALRQWTRQRGTSDIALRAAIGRGAVSRARRRRELLLDQLLARPEPDAARRVTMWAMTVRQPAFSFVSPARGMSGVVELTPCLDGEYISHFLNLSARALIDRNAYRGLVLDSIPEVAHIERGGTGAPTSRAWVNPGLRHHLRWLAKSSRGVAGARRRLRRRRTPTAEAAHWLPLLTRSARESLVFPGTDVADVAARATTGVEVNIVASLVTLDLTARVLTSGTAEALGQHQR